METQKDQYFRYYRPKTNHTSITRKSEKLKQSKKKKEADKLLPHIAEEYHFRITNHLLLKKIISPKRDKLIMQSLENVGRKLYSNHSSASSQKWRRTKQLKSMHHLKNQSSHCTETTHLISRSDVQTEQSRFRRKVIISRPPIIPRFGETTSVVENQIIDDSSPKIAKVNKPSYVPTIAKENQEPTLLHGSCFMNPPGGFGSGSTIMRIAYISFTINPPIKGDCLIQLELIEKQALNQQIRGIVDEKPQKTVKTNPFKYSQLPDGNHPQKDIKFALNRGKIGDFVPLRIWKYTGVECILVGTIDLALVSYEPQEQTTWELKKDNPEMGRRIFESEIERRLVKLKMHETEAKVRIKYKIYPKRFRRVVKSG